ncbi:cysteine hydrolase family protein [Nguyenibacter sp. L1]|uniref:cysteine hydrolase family protein n=1 Tax=Nguyenibacter sp. L1 TaxID=3049350 RepID=UPI002B4A12D1|nr:cysteine hydrolase family protein [Nguyenibacter sp. L1]WRH88777.1 cysteine hydrolase family protein [Nguyenibacter sp. L1]
MKQIGSSSANRWRVSRDAVSLLRPPRPARPVTIDALPQQVTLDLARTAMIVIDMQNDFCHPDGWLASIGVDIAPARTPIAPLAAILPVLRGRDVPVIWVNWGNRPDRLNLSPSLLHVYDPDGEGVGLGGRLPGQGDGVLELGSWNAAIVDELAPETGDIHVAKYRMSGFWDTPLDAILRNLRVDTLLFGGVNLDQCVMTTLQDAGCLGYDCILLEDCAATTSPGFCTDATLYNVRQCFGFTAVGGVLRAALGEIPETTAPSP